MINRLLGYLVKHIDRYLMGLVAALLIMGLVTLFSASGESVERVTGQLINICAALTVMWIAANVPLHYLSRIALPLYIVGLVLLVGVAVAGEVVNGARRWRSEEHTSDSSHVVTSRMPSSA